MDLVGQFIARYSKEYDFYDQASRLATRLRKNLVHGLELPAAKDLLEAGRRLQDMFEKMPKTPDEVI